MTFSLLRRELGLAGALKTRVLLRLLDRAADSATIHLEFLAVDESMRGLGIGRALLAAVDARACNAGLRQIELNVDKTNGHAYRLYLASGLREQPAVSPSLAGRWLHSVSEVTKAKEIECTTC